MRINNRKNNQLRQISIIPNINKYADGSCIIEFGDTKVLCTASIDEKLPPFLKGKNSGWITAEYSMLPRSTAERNNRDTYRPKPNGRTLEIQRLIGRSMRAIVDLKKLGERQIIIDCDVLQADGGTRCASICGGFVALKLAIDSLIQQGKIATCPIISKICAISCGIYNEEILIDLDYLEDSNCQADINFVLDENSNIIEIQGTAEKSSFTFDQLNQIYSLAKNAANDIFLLQENAIKETS